MSPPSRWVRPVPLVLLPTADPGSFAGMPGGQTGLPLLPHPGAFGFERRHHVHEGVDLYCPEGTEVRAVEAGTVVAIAPFTGEAASPPSPWWRDTWSVMVEGASGVVNYGEVVPEPSLTVGAAVPAGALLGRVATVLTVDKGRPMAMLHLELYEHGVRDSTEWRLGEPRPERLLDPTQHLASCAAAPAEDP